MKEWTIYFVDDHLTVFADNFQKEWHAESCEWDWRFSDGSMVPCRLVRAIINDTDPEMERGK